MPYKDIKELPDKIHKALPEHAQKIYMEAYNNAAEEYKDPKKRRNKTAKEYLETVAHKVAWAAVKKKYKKDTKTGEWTEA